MSIFKGMSDLEMAEALAEHENLPCSEQDVSDRYDTHIEESEPCENCGVNKVLHQLKNDSDMLHQDFSSFVDNLHTDGEIHQEQVNNYSYVGKYSEEPLTH